MIKAIKDLFTALTVPDKKDVEPDAELRLAAAVLLVEVMMADHHVDESERDALIPAIQNFMDISREESLELVRQAEARHEELVSLHEMTSVINQQCSPEQKISLIEYMWQIAYSDREWDRYEEHLIRKVADLIYVSHNNFIKAKHLAQCDE